MKESWQQLAVAVEDIPKKDLPNQTNLVKKLHDSALGLKLRKKDASSAIRILWGCAAARIRCQKLLKKIEPTLISLNLEAPHALTVLWSMARLRMRSTPIERKVTSYFNDRKWVSINKTYMSPPRVASACYSFTKLEIRQRSLSDRLSDFYLRKIDDITFDRCAVQDMGKVLFGLSTLGRCSFELVSKVIWYIKYSSSFQIALEDEHSYVTGGVFLPSTVINRHHFASSQFNKIITTVRDNLQELTIRYLSMCGHSVLWRPLSRAMYNYSSTGDVNFLLIDAVSQVISDHALSQRHHKFTGSESMLFCFSFDVAGLRIPENCIKVICDSNFECFCKPEMIPKKVLLRLIRNESSLLLDNNKNILLLFKRLVEKMIFSPPEIITLSATSKIVTVRYACEGISLKEITNPIRLSKLFELISKNDNELNSKIILFVSATRFAKELLFYQNHESALTIALETRLVCAESLSDLLLQNSLSLLDCIRVLYAASLFPICEKTTPLLDLTCAYLRTRTPEWNIYHCRDIVNVLSDITLKNNFNESPHVINTINKLSTSVQRFIDCQAAVKLS